MIQKYKHLILKLVSSMFIILFVAACDQNSVCIDEDEAGDFLVETLIAPANQAAQSTLNYGSVNVTFTTAAETEWIDTGLRVNENSDVEITTEGYINLCAANSHKIGPPDLSAAYLHVLNRPQQSQVDKCIIWRPEYGTLTEFQNNHICTGMDNFDVHVTPEAAPTGGSYPLITAEPYLVDQSAFTFAGLDPLKSGWQDTRVYIESGGVPINISVDGVFGPYDNEDHATNNDCNGHFSTYGGGFSDWQTGYDTPKNERCYFTRGNRLIVGMSDQNGNVQRIGTYASDFSNNVFTSPGAGNIYLMYEDADGNWSNNQGGYIVNISTPLISDPNCTFTEAEHLYYSVQSDGLAPPKTHHGSHVGSNFAKGVGNTTGKSGALWVRVGDYCNGTDSSGCYVDNSGEYTVNIKVESIEENPVSSLLDLVVNPIRCIMAKATTRMYVNMTGDTAEITWKQCPNILEPGDTLEVSGEGSAALYNAIRALLVLYVIFTFIGFMFGVIQMTQHELIWRLVKISIVIQIISPGSWAFFNTYIFGLFTGFMDSMIYYIMTLYGEIADQVGLFQCSIPFAGSSGAMFLTEVGGPSFGFLDPLMCLIFSPITALKMQALMWAWPMGPIVWLGIVIALVLFLMGVFKALLVYLMSMIGISLLVVISPIFICFILFQQTRPLFEGWMKQMLGFCLQPVLLFTSLVLFSFFIFAALKNIFGYSICQQCMLTLSIPIGEEAELFSICLLPGFWMPYGFANALSTADMILAGGGFGIPDILFGVLILLIFCHAMNKFNDFTGKLAQALSSSQLALTGKGGVVDSATQSMKSVVGQDRQSKAGRKQQKRFQKAVDSKVAEKTGAKPAGKKSGGKMKGLLKKVTGPGRGSGGGGGDSAQQQAQDRATQDEDIVDRNLPGDN